jgi:hypothetical protein
LIFCQSCDSVTESPGRPLRHQIHQIHLKHLKQLIHLKHRKYETYESQVPVYGDKPVIGYEQEAVTTVDPETGAETTTYVDDTSKPIYGEAPIVGYETKTEKVIVGYKKKKVCVQKETWEYEKGWRDGDFKYKG